MTDAEIIKALECCSEANSCCQCEYESDEYRKGTIGCSNAIMKDALNLINRQNAELERLKAECGNQSTLWSQHYESIYKTSKETIKAEAIKEFAERLKDTKFKHGNEYIIYAENIDNLVKEMAGDTE